MNQLTWLGEGDFVCLVEQELGFYKDLLNLERQKKAALVSSNTSALNAVVAKEERIADTLQEIEQERVALMSEAAALFSLNTEEITLRILASKCSQLTSKRLLKIKEDWLQVVFEIQEVRRVNQFLLESAMNLINVRLNGLRLAIHHEGYSDHGEQTYWQKRSLVNLSA